MCPDAVAADGLEAEVTRLRRRLDRERKARGEAETIAEKGLRDLYEKQQQLQLLEAIAAEANRATRLEDVLRFAIGQICRFTQWPLGHVYMVDRSRDSAPLVAITIWHAAEQARYAPFIEATTRYEMAVAEGLPGRVLDSAQPAWITDVLQDENFPRASAADQAGLRAGFAFPVLIGREVVAVLEFFSNRTLAPDDVLLRLMSQIGTQLGRSVERKRAEDQLRHDAYHDPLTGLPNRALLIDRLNAAIARCRHSPDYHFAMLFMDLDRFKVVNDSLGHLAGDELIVQVARRLHASLRRDDLVARPLPHDTGGEHTLARLGGDEFILLLHDVAAADDAVAVADRLQETLRAPFQVMNEEIYVSASIGIAMSASGYETAQEILRAADLAMYRAKAAGKARSAVYDETLHHSAVRRLKLESELRHAVEQRQFVLHYQPIVALDGGAVVAFEALLRWRRGNGELVYPNDFVHVLEDTGLILDVGLWVLEEACRTIKAWNEAFPNARLTMSVNVSPRQFAQPNIAAQIDAILAATGAAPEMVKLEITESATMEDAERAVAILTALRSVGVRVSIDDFGTGYSSLSYLHRFPLDLLKIDRSFVAGLDRGSDGVKIVQSIMSLARGLGMEVIAEGIETPEQHAKLLAMGCDYGQGYLFSRPVEAATALAMLSREAAGAVH